MVYTSIVASKGIIIQGAATGREREFWEKIKQDFKFFFKEKKIF